MDHKSRAHPDAIERQENAEIVPRNGMTSARWNSLHTTDAAQLGIVPMSLVGKGKGLRRPSAAGRDTVRRERPLPEPHDEDNQRHQGKDGPAEIAPHQPPIGRLRPVGIPDLKL